MGKRNITIGDIKLVLYSISMIALYMVYIYFAPGSLATIVLVIMETATDTISKDTGHQNAHPGSTMKVIIYTSLTIFFLLFSGISAISFWGASRLKRYLKNDFKK